MKCLPSSRKLITENTIKIIRRNINKLYHHSMKTNLFCLVFFLTYLSMLRGQTVIFIELICLLRISGFLSLCYLLHSPLERAASPILSTSVFCALLSGNNVMSKLGVVEDSLTLTLLCTIYTL